MSIVVVLDDDVTTSLVEAGEVAVYVLDDSDIAVVIEQAAPEIIEIVTEGPQGPTGDTGPDPWDEDIQEITHNQPGDLTIDYSLGKHVVLSLNDTVDALYVSNWPAAGKVARLTLEILNLGAHDISTYPAVRWTGGLTPALTQSSEDMLILTTSSAGARVYGHVIGLDYSVPPATPP